MSITPDTYLSLSMESIQMDVLMAVDELQEIHGKASTADVAAYTHLSYRQTLRYLQELNFRGAIRRIGKRGGWRHDIEQN